MPDVSELIDKATDILFQLPLLLLILLALLGLFFIIYGRPGVEPKITEHYATYKPQMEALLLSRMNDRQHMEFQLSHQMRTLLGPWLDLARHRHWIPCWLAELLELELSNHAHLLKPAMQERALQADKGYKRYIIPAPLTGDLRLSFLQTCLIDCDRLNIPRADRIAFVRRSMPEMSSAEAEAIVSKYTLVYRKHI